MRMLRKERKETRILGKGILIGGEKKKEGNHHERTRYQLRQQFS